MTGAGAESSFLEVLVPFVEQMGAGADSSSLEVLVPFVEQMEVGGDSLGASVVPIITIEGQQPTEQEQLTNDEAEESRAEQVA